MVSALQDQRPARAQELAGALGAGQRAGALHHYVEGARQRLFYVGDAQTPAPIQVQLVDQVCDKPRPSRIARTAELTQSGLLGETSSGCAEPTEATQERSNATPESCKNQAWEDVKCLRIKVSAQCELAISTCAYTAGPACHRST